MFLDRTTIQSYKSKKRNARVLMEKKNLKFLKFPNVVNDFGQPKTVRGVRNNRENMLEDVFKSSHKPELRVQKA